MKQVRHKFEVPSKLSRSFQIMEGISFIHSISLCRAWILGVRLCRITLWMENLGMPWAATYAQVILPPYENLFSADGNFFRAIGSNSFDKPIIPAGIYLFKVNNGNTKTVYDICSKQTNKDTITMSLTSFYCLYC